MEGHDGGIQVPHEAHGLPAPHFSNAELVRRLISLDELLGQPEPDFQSIAQHIADNGLLKRDLLRAANAIGMTRDRSIVSVRHALVMLGARRVQQLTRWLLSERSASQKTAGRISNPSGPA